MKNRAITASLMGCSMLAGVTALPSHAVAQDATATAEQAEDSGEIIVTARRAEESLQAIPVSVQVITGEKLQTMAITQATDISKLAPGLRLEQTVASPDAMQITLRGVRWATGSGTAAISTYLNDASFTPTAVLGSVFDVGQVEVVRGPQGTTRGAPSIAGAITLTTRRPDLDEIGGYASGLIGEDSHYSVQGAIGVPIVPGKLAIRLAGFYEHSRGGRVRSLFGGQEPVTKTKTARVSLRFEPSDLFSLNVMAQRQEQEGYYYWQAAGTGSPGRPAIPLLGIPSIPAMFNTNGRAISFKDYVSVAELGNNIDRRVDLITVNATWDVLGQRLSYNFGYQKIPSFGFNTDDEANVVPGFDRLAAGGAPGGNWQTHEVRLSSIREPGRFFDYDIGFFSQRDGDSRNPITADRSNYLSGAFGPALYGLPGQVSNPVSRYVVRSFTEIDIQTRNYSFFGNVQLHITEKTEVSAGLRWIHDRRPVTIGTRLFPTFFNVSPLAFIVAGAPPAAQPFITSCEAAGLITSPVYAGTCDTLAVPAQAAVPQTFNDRAYTPVIWNASISHKFTPDLMVYATAGTSWRQGLPAIGNDGLPNDLLVPNPEKATSYELGVKASFGRGFRVAVDIFQIDYKDQLTSFEGIPYFNANAGRAANAGVAFYRNVDARVRGIEADIALRPARGFDLNLSLSYAKIQSRGGLVPCPGPVSAANPINFCTSQAGETLNPTSPFQANLNGSYEIPINNRIGGYFRFNVNYQGNNPAYGVSDAAFSAKSYALVDLFAGLTGNDGAWDLGFYGKNVFNTKRLLTSTTLPVIYGYGSSAFGVPDVQPGLSRVSSTVPRELGVQFRYSFGAR